MLVIRDLTIRSMCPSSISSTILMALCQLSRARGVIGRERENMSALIIMERRPYRRSERHGEDCEVRSDASPSGVEEGAGGGLTIVAVTALVSHRAANIVRLGFVVLGIVIKAIATPELRGRSASTCPWTRSPSWTSKHRVGTRSAYLPAIEGRICSTSQGGHVPLWQN